MRLSATIEPLFQRRLQMVRISKQAEKRSRFPRRHGQPQEKTGSKQDNLSNGFNEHVNAVSGDLAAKIFIPKIK